MFIRKTGKNSKINIDSAKRRKVWRNNCKDIAAENLKKKYRKNKQRRQRYN